MTRVEQTKEEQRLGRELMSFFNSQDFKFVVRAQEDRPDFLFELCGELIACEAVQVPPSEIFQYVHKRLHETPDDKAIGTRVTWAEEPHMWVASAVKAKRSNIVAYKRQTGARRCWLLVHTPAQDSQIFVRGSFSWESQMLRYGASLIPSGFDRILFWEPKSGMQFIHRRGEHHPSVKFDLSKGYPSRSFTIFSAPFSNTAKNEAPREYDFGEIEMRDIIIPPMDRRFIGLSPAGRLWNYKLKITAFEDRAEVHPEIIRVR